jgi:hypothetical protein
VRCRTLTKAIEPSGCLKKELPEIASQKAPEDGIGGMPETGGEESRYRCRIGLLLNGLHPAANLPPPVPGL